MRIYSNRNMIVQSQLSYLLTLRTVGEALDASLSGVPSVGTGYGVLQLCKRLRLYGSTSHAMSGLPFLVVPNKRRAIVTALSASL